MLVRRVQLMGFPTDGVAWRDVELPARGLVLVTGPNGSGKSSLVEAVSWCLWGKSLRGATPAGRAAVAVQGMTNCLSADRCSKKLEWACAPEPPASYPSVTKAYEALAQHLPDWDAWRRTHVFSSADAAAFAGATDGERKRLLERVLDLGRFDRAAELARREVALATDAKIRASNDQALELVRAAGCRRLAERIEKELQGLPALLLEEVERQFADTLAARDQASALCDHTHARCRDAGETLWRAQSEADEAARWLALCKAGRCGECGREFAVNPSAAAHRHLGAVARRDEALQARDAALRAEQAAQKNFDRANRQFQLAQATLEHQRVLSPKAEAARRDREAALAEEHEALELAERYGQEGQAASQEAETARHCAEVLGLKGARTLLLRRSVDQLSARANALLRELSDGAMQTTATVSDEGKLDVEVQASGLSRSYEACSAGERRRVDVAYLLALSELAGGSGTLFLDEVLDALDEDGCRAACELVARVAEKRPVVLITHRDDVRAHLRYDQLVETGK